MRKVVVCPVEAARVERCREGNRLRYVVGWGGDLRGMRGEEIVVPLILGRVPGANGAHAEVGWAARGTDEQYRPLCGLIFLELSKSAVSRV